MYHYKVVMTSLATSDQESKMNSLAAEGWEFITANIDGICAYLYFKKQI